MSNIWHSYKEIPECILNRNVDIEVEMGTDKVVKAKTAGYGFSKDNDDTFTFGWMWVKRWRFLNQEEKIKSSGL